MDLSIESVAKGLATLRGQIVEFEKYWSDSARQASIEARQARARGRAHDHEEAKADHMNSAASHRHERAEAEHYGKGSGVPYEKGIESHERAAQLHGAAADEYRKAEKAYGKGNGEKGDKHMAIAENLHVSAHVMTGNAERMSAKLHAKMRASGIRSARKRLDDLMTKVAALLAA